MKKPKSQPKEDIETRFAEIAEAYRRQQETLARQNKFLINIMESLPHPFYVIDASDYTIKMANSSAAPSGVPPGATCFVLTHGRDEPCGGSEHVCPVETIKRTKQSLITEHIHYDTEGNLRNVEVHGHPILDDNGDVVQVIEYTLDITERKRAEEKLLRAKREWECAFDSVPDLIAILDTQHRVLRANREMARRLGVTPKECVGLLCYEVVHGKNHPPVSCPHLQTLNDGLEHVAEVVEERLGGDFLVTTTPLLDEKGVMIGTVHVARDITVRKRMENELRKSRDELELRVEERTAELRRSEAYLAEAQRLTHTGSWVRSKTGEMVYISEELYRIFGLDPQEGIPSRETLGRRVHPDDLDGARANVEKSIREKVDIFEEYRILLPGGTIKHIQIIRHPVLNDAGDVVQLVGTAMDITDRKRAEETLRRLNRELRAISNCNQILLRATDEQSLLKEICRIVCEEAGYRMAWVGYAEHDKARSVRPVVWTGAEEGYLATAGITWADTERGRGPAGTAIRSGKSCYIQDYATDPRFAPWRESALQRGFRSGIVLPLMDEHAKAFGCLCIYSAERNAFTSEEIWLLEQLAADLAFGIVTLRSRAARKRAEQEVALLSFALDKIRETALLIDDRGRFHYVNEEGCRVLGYTRAELLGLGVSDIDPEFPAERWSHHWRSLKAQRSLSFESRHRTQDGHIFPVEVNANYFEYGGREYNLALARDITERKRAEEERVSHLKFLECMDRINQAMQGTNDLDQMISNVLDAMLSIFDSDRAFLDYPCDPDAASFEVVIERTRPEYPRPTGVIPTPPDTARNFRLYLASSGPVTLGPGCDCPLEVSHYSQESQILIALYPKTGKPWLLGMHQCSYPRVWTQDEKKLLNEIARRMTDALTSLLTHRDLHESEERYRVILRTAMDGFFRTDMQGRILEVNETYCRMSGYSEQELLTMNVADISAVRTAAEIIAADIRRFVEEGPQRFESVHRRKDGSLFDVEIGAQYQPIASGQAVVFVRDITERKRAEEALRQSEAYLAEAQRLSHTGCWALDMASGKVYSSEENSRIYGFDPQEGPVIWEAALERVHPEDLDRVKECIEKSIREKVDTSNEHRIMLPDGTVKHIYATRRPVLNDAGEVVKLVGTQIDITERKRAEEALRASEHKYRELVENANSIILRWNSRGDITFLNEFGQKFFGYQEDEILGRNVVGTITPQIESTGRDLRPLMAKIYENPTVFEQNINENMLRDGSRVWIAWTNKTAFDAEGKLTEVLSIGSDITERKCAEEALRRSEAYLAEAQRLSHTGSWALDVASGEYDYLSEELFRIFGSDPQEGPATWEAALERVHPEDLDRVKECIEKSIREKVDTFEEYRIVLPDGTVKHLYAVRHPVLNEAGDIVKMVGTTMDITERRLAEEALQNLLADLESRVEERTKELSEANQSLQAANKELDGFTYSVSHDLRAPLRAIDGFSMMVLKEYADKLDDEGRRKLNVIRSNTQQMGRLIDDLLTFSRMGRKEMANASLDMEALVRSAWRELTQLNPERRIQFSVQRLPHGMGDQTLIKEVVVNLLSNAIKFTKHRENAIVEVGAYPEKETDVYFVKDNGAGFDMQYHDKLFGVFQRLHSVDEFEGTGVGLAIVERIIHRHGGRVWAEGKEGEGATFYFTLPRRGDG
jgi:PAS domain S-box-containing protein